MPTAATTLSLSTAAHAAAAAPATTWAASRAASFTLAVPPARLRVFLSAYGSLVTVLRRQPVALTEAMWHAGVGAPIAVPLMLSFVCGHTWRRDDADALYAQKSLLDTYALAPWWRAAQPYVRRVGFGEEGV